MNIFVNGTFDILHTGHLKLLEYAKSLGTHLTVAIDGDDRVKSLKGSSRPINNQYDRQYMLYMLKPVDNVVIFHTDQQLVEMVADCDIMVKGADYRHQRVIGESVCKRIVYFDRVDEYSTTATIQRITDRR